jgi:hypothetical protein
MMAKSAQPGEGGGGARPPPFTLSTITNKVVVYAPAERTDTLPLFLLYLYMYFVVPTTLDRLDWRQLQPCAGIFKQSRGARKRVRIGLLCSLESILGLLKS